VIIWRVSKLLSAGLNLDRIEDETAVVLKR
jgi:hypothetical protein